MTENWKWLFQPHKKILDTLALRMILAILFPGKDSDLETSADNVRPFNAFLQQQTILNTDEESVFLMPNLVWTDNAPTFTYYANGDSLVVQFEVKNIGEAAMASPIYFSLYKETGALTSQTIIESKQFDKVFLYNQTGTFKIKVFDLYEDYPPDLTTFTLRLNDNNTTFPKQDEYDISDSTRVGTILPLCPDVNIWTGATDYDWNKGPNWKSYIYDGDEYLSDARRVHEYEETQTEKISTFNFVFRKRLDRSGIPAMVRRKRRSHPNFGGLPVYFRRRRLE